MFFGRYVLCETYTGSAGQHAVYPNSAPYIPQDRNLDEDTTPD